MSVSQAAFREALSHFASGVVVVATHTPKGPVGLTASAFTSVSLEPPLVLFCIGSKASTYERVLSAATFGISVLHENQLWIAQQFARHGIDRFAGVPLSDAPVPLVEGALARLECERHALHIAGDHAIVVARVTAASLGKGRPLVHYARAFGGFAGEPAPEPHRSVPKGASP
jgi:flavin reductase (DIM6/NTAB) family NADH-FMN oxidoreductase RutF